MRATCHFILLCFKLVSISYSDQFLPATETIWKHMSPSQFHLNYAARLGLASELSELLQSADRSSAKEALYQACQNNQLKAAEVILDSHLVAVEPIMLFIADRNKSEKMLALLDKFSPMEGQEVYTMLKNACASGDVNTLRYFALKPSCG